MKKRLLFVHHNSTLGGAELSLFDLISRIPDNFIPICALPEGPLMEKFSNAGIKTVAVSMRPLSKSINPFEQLASGSNCMKVHSQLKKICQQEEISLIHANSLTSAIYASKAAKDLKIPLLWHERDLSSHPVITPQIAKFATRIIAISNAVAENLKKQLGDSDKIRLIHNGIDIAKFSNPTTDGIPDLPEDRKKVLMAGQFVEWKGHLDFIEVAKEVKKEMPETVFILAGDKTKPEQQKYISELEYAISGNGLEEQFIWTGFVENMPGLLQNVDCVAVPSHGEPFGRIVIEAMAAGKPVLGYASGALPEIIEGGESGFLVTDGDIKGMAVGIVKVLNDNALSDRISRNSELLVSQNFTIQQTVAKFEELVNEVLI